MAGTNNDEIENSTTFSANSRLHIFPLRLHQMLFDAEKDGLATVVSWLPHGQSFRVNDKEQFVNQIMPKYFKHTQYKSFQRQLNLWGFKRITRGYEKNAVHHEHFRRGRPELCNHINDEIDNSTPFIASSSRLYIFPLKLHQMLFDAEKDGFASVVSWLPHGQSFRVNNKDKFVNQIMPKYFKQTRYKSFQRQLHIWGFKRVTIGHEKNSVHNEHFRRGHPELCNHMTRVKIKSETTTPAGGMAPQIMNSRRGSLGSISSARSDVPPLMRSSDCSSFESQSPSLDQPALSTPSSIVNGVLSNSTSTFHSALSTPSSIVHGGLPNSTSSLGNNLSPAEQQLLLAYRQLNSPSFVPYPTGAISSGRHPEMAGLRLTSSSCRQANQGVPPNLLGPNSTNPAAAMLTAPNPPPSFRGNIEQEKLLRQQFINGISMNLLLRR